LLKILIVGGGAREHTLIWKLAQSPKAEGSLKGRSPFKTRPSPSPFKERGTQGVRLINNH